MLPKCGFIFCAVLLFICSEVHSGLTVIETPKVKVDVNPDPGWLKDAVIYQIYPRSFKEGDTTRGIGNLKGIDDDVLKHLKAIGTTVIWFSQIYDPEDFTKVHSDYGTNDEFKTLIEKIHLPVNNMRVMVDFDINHSSKKNKWFIDSEAGVDPYKDYYLWRDGKPVPGGESLPPNNWKSVYNDSAWERSSTKAQFYLHQFAIDQPDLNYDNPDVETAMKAVFKEWLELGVDGIILDTVPFLFEGDTTINEKPISNIDDYKYESLIHSLTKDQQKTFDFIYRLRKFIDDYDTVKPRVLITAANTDLKDAMRYFKGTDVGGRTAYGAHITLNFLLLPHHKGTTTLKLVESINEWTNAITKDNQIGNWLIGDHYHHRAATRFGDENVDNMNILIGSLPGIMITYNGEEIGQENGEVTYLQCQDPIGCKAGPADFPALSRDFERTPYHWDGSTYAGFTGVAATDTWLPVSEKHTETNLGDQKVPLDSHYNIYKDVVTKLRAVLNTKKESNVKYFPDDVIQVTRGSITDKDGYFMVLINMGAKEAKVKAAGAERQLYEVQYSTDDSIKDNEWIFEKDLTIAAHKAVILKAIPIKAAEYDWWKNAVIYQIYVRSFKDSDNDGVGDLEGIIGKLEYLKGLGVNVICLSSILDSPDHDLGYDVRDFKKILPLYDSGGKFDALIEATKKLEIKVIMDFVPNHSSNQDSKFKDDTDREKYYVIADKPNDKPDPSNWLSIYHGKAWSEVFTGGNPVTPTGKFYLHQFDTTQPDFNYNNPEVIEYIEDALKHWLDQGIAGFRMTGVPYLVEDEKFPDEPPSNDPESEKGEYKSLRHVHTSNRPATFNIIYEWRKLLDIYTAINGGHERIMITEANTDSHNTIYYYGTQQKRGAHLSLNFQLTETINETSNAHAVAAKINEWADFIPEGFTSNWMLGNHDKHRAATRFGPENVDGFNMLAAILPGVMVTYNGEEIGMEDGEVPLNNCNGDPVFCKATQSEAEKQKFIKFRRDVQRTPFHWDSSAHAGFTTDKARDSWLPVSRKYLKTNLALQINEANSHYGLYRRLIDLRQKPAFLSGSLKVQAVTEYVLASLRYHTANESYFHLFNLGGNEEMFNLKTAYSNSTPVLEVIETNNPELLPTGTLLDARNITLRGHQSVIAVFTAKELPGSATMHVISSFVLLLGLLISSSIFI